MNLDVTRCQLSLTIFFVQMLFTSDLSATAQNSKLKPKGTPFDGAPKIKQEQNGNEKIQQKNGDEILKNTTYLLNTLLSEDNYNRQIRPDFGGPPIVIKTDIEIRSMGPISETDMIYSMDCYFRQTWYDKRLVFGDKKERELSMDWKFLQKVWVPDSHFVNGKHSYLHKITVPNRFFRVREDGRLKYSMRLTIKASCPMYLRKYPLDLQVCPLEVGSFGYTAKDVQFIWASADPVVMAKNVTLSQYDILNMSVYNRTMLTPDGDRIMTAMVNFYLYRRHGYFILQIYIPCGLIVAASWVTFWIDREAVPARVTLGVTTILTMTTLGFGGKSNLPRTSYATALDTFVIICFGFVFSAMIEYACVNYIEGKEHSKLKRAVERKHHRESTIIQEYTSNEDGQLTNLEDDDDDEDDELTIEGERMVSDVIEVNVDSCESEKDYCFKWFRKIFNRKRNFSHRSMDVLEIDGAIYTRYDRASIVDIWSRKLFPLTFIALTLLYWIIYTYLLEDESERLVLKKQIDSFHDEDEKFNLS